MIDSLLQYDQQLFLYLNSLGNTAWDGFWLFITGKWSAIPLYLLLLILSYRQLGLRRTLVLLLVVALLVTTTDQLANFFKYGLRRLRPCYDPDLSGLVRLVKDSCGGRYGYFSAHASNTMGVAVFMSMLLRKRYSAVVYILLAWAVATAYSRVYLGVHFPLDIISGMLIGGFLGWLFHRLFHLSILKLRL